MKIKIPDEVRHAIKDADLAAFARRSAEIRAAKATKEREQARLLEIDELRAARHDELRQRAEYVLGWRAAFVQTEEAQRIREIVGDGTRLTVFCAKYWRGEPLPPDDRQAWAVFAIEGRRSGSAGLPPFWYEEKFKGHTSYEKRIATRQQLIDAVHPDFLKELHEHLNGPDAWKFILQELKRYAAR